MARWGTLLLLLGLAVAFQVPLTADTLPAQGVFFDTMNTGIESLRLSENPMSLSGLFFKTVLALVFILALIFAASRFYNRSRKILGGKEGVIRQLYVHPLGTNRYLLLIETGGKILLLGVTENSINLLTEFADSERVNAVKLELSERTDGRFGDLFRKEVPSVGAAPARNRSATLLDRLRRWTDPGSGE